MIDKTVKIAERTKNACRYKLICGRQKLQSRFCKIEIWNDKIFRISGDCHAMYSTYRVSTAVSLSVNRQEDKKGSVLVMGTFSLVCCSRRPGWCLGPSCQPLRGLGSASASQSEKTTHRIKEEKKEKKERKEKKEIGTKGKK